MYRFAMAALLGAGLLLTLPIQAGEFNKKLSIGDAAPTWSDLPGVDGKGKTSKSHGYAPLSASDAEIEIAA